MASVSFQVLCRDSNWQSIEFSYYTSCNNKLIENKLEYGPMPNVVVALPNIGGALCSTPQSLADAHSLDAVQ